MFIKINGNNPARREPIWINSDLIESIKWKEASTAHAYYDVVMQSGRSHAAFNADDIAKIEDFLGVPHSGTGD